MPYHDSYSMPIVKGNLPSLVYDQLVYSLEISPGTNSDYYSIDLNEAPYNTFGVTLAKKSENFLVVGVSSDMSYVSTITDIYSLKNICMGNNYTVSYNKGDSLNIYICVGCIKKFILPSEYDITNLSITTSGSIPTVNLISGVSSSTLSNNYFKLWRVSFKATDNILPVSIGFKDTSANFTTFKNLRIKSIYDDNLISDPVVAVNGYASNNIFNINIINNGNISNYIWQRLLSDLSYKNITTVLNSTTISQDIIGPLTVGSEVTSYISLRNTTISNITIISITAKVSTSLISNIKVGLNKDKVSDDFKLSVIDNSIETILPAFTGSALSRSIPLNISIAPLNSFDLKVNYKPKLKVIPTMLISTSSPIADIINKNRWLDIIVEGYIGSSTTLVKLGDTLIFKGAVS